MKIHKDIVTESSETWLITDDVYNLESFYNKLYPYLKRQKTNVILYICMYIEE